MSRIDQSILIILLIQNFKNISVRINQSSYPHELNCIFSWQNIFAVYSRPREIRRILCMVGAAYSSNGHRVLIDHNGIGLISRL